MTDMKYIIDINIDLKLLSWLSVNRYSHVQEYFLYHYVEQLIKFDYKEKNSNLSISCLL